MEQFAKQFTFSQPTECTHVYIDGREERVRYGQFEGIMITKENGWDVGRTRILIPGSYGVTELTKQDGTILVFDYPIKTIEERYFADGSGREAPLLSGHSHYPYC